MATWRARRPSRRRGHIRAQHGCSVLSGSAAPRFFFLTVTKSTLSIYTGLEPEVGTRPRPGLKSKGAGPGISRYRRTGSRRPPLLTLTCTSSHTHTHPLHRRGRLGKSLGERGPPSARGWKHWDDLGKSHAGGVDSFFVALLAMLHTVRAPGLLYPLLVLLLPTNPGIMGVLLCLSAVFAIQSLVPVHICVSRDVWWSGFHYHYY
jgi:hypothetical protein